MTHRRRDERVSRAEEIFNAHMARHEARMAMAMAAHERALAGAELRAAHAMRAHERAMEALELRAADVLRRDRQRRPEDPFGRRWGRRRPDAEGGESMPAVPGPRPNPLAGAAAAPIE
jgi:hypothetical protein